MGSVAELRCITNPLLAPRDTKRGRERTRQGFGNRRGELFS